MTPTARPVANLASNSAAVKTENKKIELFQSFWGFPYNGKCVRKRSLARR